MRIKKILINLLAIFMAIVFLLPLVWMLIVSLKPEGVQAINIKEWFDFTNLTLNNYIKVITTSQILRWTVNSVIISLVTTVLVILLSSLAAYAFSLKRFRLKTPLFILIMSGILIPTEAIMVPLFDISLNLGLIDNFWGVILPGIVNPLGIILLKQFMDGIPKAYIEAARIDGCRDLRLWWNICLPLTKSAMVSVGIFYFIMSWNNFLWPYICLTSKENMVLSSGLPTFLGNNILLVNNIMAASALAAIPTMIVFLFLQNQIVEGVAMTGVKG